MRVAWRGNCLAGKRKAKMLEILGFDSQYSRLVSRYTRLFFTIGNKKKPYGFKSGEFGG